MLEKEYKVLLHAEQYHCLESLFVWDRDDTQINFYYIDKDMQVLLRNISIRIRIKNGRIFLQVKIPVATENSLHIKKEYEKELNIIPKNIYKKELCELTGQNLPDVQLVDALITQRKAKKVKNCEIALDYNRYLGFYDYELEYVGDPPYEILKLFSEQGIFFGKSSMGKYSRFFHQYTNNNKKLI